MSVQLNEIATDGAVADERVESGVRIDPGFRGLIPPLDPEELERLEADIIANGCRDPLVIARWGEGTALADGHNRFDICRRYDITFKTVTLDFEDPESAELWIKENQLARRNLTDDQRATIAEEVAQARSDELKRQRARKAAAASHGLSLVSCDKQKRDARIEVSKQAKIPRRKIGLRSRTSARSSGASSEGTRG